MPHAMIMAKLMNVLSFDMIYVEIFRCSRRYEQSHLLDTGVLAQHIATTISQSQLTIVEPIAVLLHRFNSSRTEMLTDLSRSIRSLVSIRPRIRA